MIPNAVDIFRLWMFKVVCIAIRHDGGHIVVLALLLGSVGGDIERDVLGVCSTRQKLAIVVATSIKEDCWDP